MQTSDTVQALVQSQREFNAAVSGLSDEEASAHPEPGCWSVLEQVEHLVMAESRLGMIFSMATKQDEGIRDLTREADLAAAVRDRSRKISAPERIHPTGKFRTTSEALQAFNAARTSATAFATEHEAELDTWKAAHPVFGSISMREWLVLVAGHSGRHVEQIRETLRASKAHHG